MSQIIGDFLNDLLEGMRERLDKKLEEVALEEENIGIQKATAAMCEAGVEDGKIIDLLQKYWNLRPSEAKDFLSRERHD